MTDDIKKRIEGVKQPATNPGNDFKMDTKLIEVSAETYIAALTTQEAAKNIETSLARFEQHLPEICAQAFQKVAMGFYSTLADHRLIAVETHKQALRAAEHGSAKEAMLWTVCIVFGVALIAVFVGWALHRVW